MKIVSKNPINQKIFYMKYGKKIIVRFITFDKTGLGMLYFLEYRAVTFHPTNKVTGTRNHEVVMNKSLVGQIRLAV